MWPSGNTVNEVLILTALAETKMFIPVKPSPFCNGIYIHLTTHVMKSPQNMQVTCACFVMRFMVSWSMHGFRVHVNSLNNI